MTRLANLLRRIAAHDAQDYPPGRAPGVWTNVAGAAAILAIVALWGAFLSGEGAHWPARDARMAHAAQTHEAAR